MALTAEQVRHVAKLAELELTSVELQTMATDLSAILAHVDQLQSVTTLTELQTQTAGSPDLPLRLRADLPRPGVPHDRALLPAPKTLDDGFAVPAFVDD